MNQQISSNTFTPTARPQLHSLFQTFINDIHNNQNQSYFLDAKKNFQLPEPNHSFIFPIKGRTPLSRLYLAPELANKSLNIFSKDQLIKIDVWILAVLTMKKVLGQIYKPITSDQSVEDKKRTLKENIFNIKKRYGIEFAELFAKMTCIEPEQRLTLPEIQKRLDALCVKIPDENVEKQSISSYTVNLKQILDVHSSGLENFDDAALQKLMESIKTRQPEKFEWIKIHLEGCKLRDPEDTSNLAKLITILKQHFENLKTLQIDFEDENGANERAVCLSFSLYQNEIPSGLRSLSVNLQNCREFNMDTMNLLIVFMFSSSINLAELENLELNLHGCQKITDDCVNTFLGNFMGEKLVNLTINAKKTRCTKGAEELCKDFPNLEKINSTVLI